MDGLIVLDKPAGLTSARALDRVRRITGVRKSGHAGTLDPLATGVLLICLGKGTKLVERLMDQPKGYRATARLDITSASFDIDHPVSVVRDATPPTPAQVAAALATFQGDIEQIPPQVSALKVGGRPAYERQRRGEDFVLPAKRVHVYWTALERYEWPEVDFAMACGRGTYVRALVRDLGQRLSTGGCITRLRRTAVGPFVEVASWTLERLADADWRAATIPVERVVAQTAGGAVVPVKPVA